MDKKFDKAPWLQATSPAEVTGIADFFLIWPQSLPFVK